jgi:hypothetical protein
LGFTFFGRSSRFGLSLNDVHTSGASRRFAFVMRLGSTGNGLMMPV